MADINLMNPMELQPKDILQFVEKREDRALEVLREIISAPEYDNVVATQAIGMANAFGSSTNVAWSNALTGAGGLIATPMVAQAVTPNG